MSVASTQPALVAAPVRAPHAPPEIANVWLSSLTIASGTRWAGSVTTSTNVASVELRTPYFSSSIARRAFGQFAFDFRIPDLPPLARRTENWHVIARNADGAAVEELIPISVK